MLKTPQYDVVFTMICTCKKIGKLPSKSSTMKILISLLLPIAFLSTFGQNPYEVKPTTVEEKHIDTRSDFSKQLDFVPITKWTEGMKFIVTPPSLNFPDEDIAMSLYQTKKNDRIYLLKQSEWKYKIFTFKRLEDSKGYFDCNAVFENEGVLYKFTVPASISMLQKNETFANRLWNLKGLAYLKDIDLAKSGLTGKSIYILTKDWHQNTPDGERIMIKGSKKFYKVTVMGVGVGNDYVPVRVVFKDGETEAFVDLYISGINTTADADVFGGPFDKMFSFEDPRKSYPEISDETWNNIQEGLVKIGMSEAEMKLSLGQPDKKNETILNGLKTIQFVYGKNYVYIDNGRVTSIQTSN